MPHSRVEMKENERVNCEQVIGFTQSQQYKEKIG